MRGGDRSCAAAWGEATENGGLGGRWALGTGQREEAGGCWEQVRGMVVVVRVFQLHSNEGLRSEHYAKALNNFKQHWGTEGK